MRLYFRPKIPALRQLFIKLPTAALTVIIARAFVWLYCSVTTWEREKKERECNHLCADGTKIELILLPVRGRHLQRN